MAATDATSLLGGAAQAASASSLLERQLDERLTEFTLPNGLRFLVFERRAAPIASFHVRGSPAGLGCPHCAALLWWGAVLPCAACVCMPALQLLTALLLF